MKRHRHNKKDRPSVSGRIALLDELRGLAILAMVLYHAAYDLIFYYDSSIPIFFSPLVEQILHPLFAGLFLFLSGVSCRLSGSNLIRGLKLLFFALILSIVTGLVSPDGMILFGILHLLSCCILLFCLTRPLLDRLPPRAAGAGFLFLFLAVRLWLTALRPVELGGLSGFGLYLLGYPVRGFQSADYFPFLPWGLAFFSGCCFGQEIQKLPLSVKKGRVPFLAKVGRHTLWIYLLHQPILLLLFQLVFGW